MRRNHEIKIRFSKEELDALTKKVRKTHFSREGFCRMALNGIEIKEAPPADFPELIKQIRRCADSVSELLMRANDTVTEDEFKSTLKEIHRVDKLIWKTFT